MTASCCEVDDLPITKFYTSLSPQIGVFSVVLSLLYLRGQIMAKKDKIEVEEPLQKKLWNAADKLLKNVDAAIKGLQKIWLE